MGGAALGSIEAPGIAGGVLTSAAALGKSGPDTPVRNIPGLEEAFRTGFRTGR